MPPGEHPDKIVWLNGDFLPVTEARISPLDRGYLYGDGVFETIRGDYGTPMYLSNHIARILGSAAELQILFDGEYDWMSVVRELLRRNDYIDKVSRIKMIVSRGVQHGLDLRETDTPTVLIYANSYTLPEKKYKNGWKLHAVRDGVAPRMAKYKSLNYLYYLSIRQEAIENHADDALIIDENDEATETATGSLLLCSNGQWWMPSAEFQLPGLARSHVISILKDKGYDVEKRPATYEAMLAADTIWVTNSMVGIIPIVEISGYPVKDPLFEEAAIFRNEYIIRGKRDVLTLLKSE